MKVTNKKIYQLKAFQRVAKQVLGMLKGYKWCMVSGNPSLTYSNLRRSTQIVCLAKIGARDASRFIKSSESHGLRLLKKDYIPWRCPEFLFVDDRSGLEVVIFIVKDGVGKDDAFVCAIDGAIQARVGSFQVPVPHPEDVVILKASLAVLPMRGKLYDEDVDDIKNIFKQTKLDRDYIEIVLSQSTGDWDNETKLLRDLGVI